MLSPIQKQPELPAFLQKLNAEIEPYLSDRGLDVRRMTRLAGMSRTDLHRKLYRATGMSATQYLRQRRLEKAAKMLREEPEWSIYQVALEVGFSTPSYFTVRFKEVFGCCPGEWRERLEHL